MYLFTILAIILIALTLIMTVIIGAIGAIGIVVFGDVIVCMAIIVLIMRALIIRKRRRG